jgi:two-component system, OmpR family, response regulator MprA
VDRVPISVLVADDEASLLLLYRVWLEEAGYEVRTATDGVKALEAVAVNGLPDAAILDVEMPRLDGLDVARFLRLQSATMPILFVTARDDPHDDVQAAGGNDVLAKPSDRDRLLLALRDASRAAARSRAA